MVFIQISKCLGNSLQPNGHGVDAKDLAEKMQLLSAQVSKENLCIAYYMWSAFMFFQ